MMVQVDMLHTPVLLDAVLQYLDPRPGETYLDLTAGYGGHARSVLSRTLGAPATLVDRDKTAIDHLKKQFQRKQVRIVYSDFLSASLALEKTNKQFDLILADLGVSSPHLNTASRGFSLTHNGPLDMRMDLNQTQTAEAIINTYSEDNLYGLFKKYGEEPFARSIAKAIVLNRPLKQTTELANLIAKVVRWKSHKIHPATRVFQALRIVVNDELEQLGKALPIWIQLLKPGGRLVIISFHSLEDRIVKHALKEVSDGRYDAILRPLIKTPIIASPKEIAINPRARSAKLRAAVKNKNLPVQNFEKFMTGKEREAHANTGKKHLPSL